MKVIAKLDHDKGYLIEISKEEASMIIAGDKYNHIMLKSGDKINVDDRFTRVIRIADSMVGSASYASVRSHIEDLLKALEPVEALVREVKIKTEKK